MLLAFAFTLLLCWCASLGREVRQLRDEIANRDLQRLQMIAQLSRNDQELVALAGRMAQNIRFIREQQLEVTAQHEADWLDEAKMN